MQSSFEDKVASVWNRMAIPLLWIYCFCAPTLVFVSYVHVGICNLPQLYFVYKSEQ